MSSSPAAAITATTRKNTCPIKAARHNSLMPPHLGIYPHPSAEVAICRLIAKKFNREEVIFILFCPSIGLRLAALWPLEFIIARAQTHPKKNHFKSECHPKIKQIHSESPERNSVWASNRKLNRPGVCIMRINSLSYDGLLCIKLILGKMIDLF